MGHCAHALSRTSPGTGGGSSPASWELLRSISFVSSLTEFKSPDKLQIFTYASPVGFFPLPVIACKVATRTCEEQSSKRVL